MIFDILQIILVPPLLTIYICSKILCLLKNNFYNDKGYLFFDLVSQLTNLYLDKQEYQQSD